MNGYTRTQLLTQEEGQAAQYIRHCASAKHEDDIEDAVNVLVRAIEELRLLQFREEVTLVSSAREFPLMADEEPPKTGT